MLLISRSMDEWNIFVIFVKWNHSPYFQPHGEINNFLPIWDQTPGTMREKHLTLALRHNSGKL